MSPPPSPSPVKGEGLVARFLLFEKGFPMEKDFLDVIESEVPKDGVLISVGLPGSWKSPVTEEIAKIKGFQILRSDLIRLEVLKGLDVFDNKVASDPDNRRKVYEEMFRQTMIALEASKGGLILDATFFTQELRFRAAELAMKANRALVIAECVCTEEKSIERILKRTKENYESNALTREAYLNNKALFQAVDIDALKKQFKSLPIIHLTIDTEYNTLLDWKIRKIEKR
jgi:predicted kinase